jgi:hypothetical protein
MQNRSLILTLSPLLLVLCIGLTGVAHATTGCNAIGWDQKHGDVQGCSLYYPAIAWMYEKGIAEGVQDPADTTGTRRLFQPSRTINRAEFTKLVLLASGVNNPPPCPTAPFPDVPKNAWFAPYVCSAKEKGIIGGFPDGTFKPGININFANGAKILAKTFSLPIDSPNAIVLDGQTIWYHPYTEALRKQKVTAPTVRNFDQSLTRGEMAEMLYRLVTKMTSLDPPADPENTGLGTGYVSFILEEALGVYLSSSIDSSYFFEPSKDSFYSAFGRERTAQGHVFAHAIYEERCGASGMWEHCSPLWRDWSIGLYKILTPSGTLESEMRSIFKTEVFNRTFGNRDALCVTAGIEGEYSEVCVMELGPQSSLLVQRDYVDSTFINISDITPLPEQERIYEHFRQSIQFSIQ